MKPVTRNGVVVITGPPCGGKSFVRQALGAMWVDRDGLFPGSSRDRNHRKLAYDAVHAVARVVLESGYTPVLECTYARAEQRSSLVTAIADQPWARLWVVEISVSADEAVRRFRMRDEPTDLDEAALRERVAAFPYSAAAFHLLSEQAPGLLAERIAAWLDDPNATPIDRQSWAEAGRAWA
jgi:predicted kinase